MAEVQSVSLKLNRISLRLVHHGSEWDPVILPVFKTGARHLRGVEGVFDSHTLPPLLSSIRYDFAPFPRFFFVKYQSFTSNSLPPFARSAASFCVTGAGTMTGSPTCQFAGVAHAFASAVCSASKTRMISSMFRPNESG